MVNRWCCSCWILCCWPLFSLLLCLHLGSTPFSCNWMCNVLMLSNWLWCTSPYHLCFVLSCLLYATKLQKWTIGLWQRILAAWRQVNSELKSKWIMVYLKQCRYCVVNMVQRSGALDVVELGYTSVLLGVAISSRHLSVFVSFLFLLVQWGSTRQSRYVGEGSYLLESRMVGSKVVRNLTQNTWFQLTILYTLQL
jgi:hypothetical protein